MVAVSPDRPTGSTVKAEKQLRKGPVNVDGYMVSVAAESRCRRFTSPPTSDPPMNEEGHVSTPRRGLLAAGLAAAVVGSLGVFSTMNAAADETPAAAAVVEDPLGPVEPGL